MEGDHQYSNVMNIWDESFQEGDISDQESNQDSENDSMDQFVHIPMARRSIFEKRKDTTDTASVEEHEIAACPLKPAEETLQIPESEHSDFVWMDFSSAFPSHVERKEEFLPRECGSTVTLSNVYDAFIVIWSADIMEHIMEVTNKKLRKNPKNIDSKNTNIDELYVLLALIIDRGLSDKKHSQTPYNEETLKKYMGHPRFYILLIYLQFNDDVTEPTNITDNFHVSEIEPLVSYLNTKFQRLYNLTQNLVINKHHSLHKSTSDTKTSQKLDLLKREMFELYESHSGYLWSLAFSGDWSTLFPTEESKATDQAILDLIKGLEGKGHTIWFTNCQNSLLLVRKLKSLKFDCVGPLNKLGQHVPRRIRILTTPYMEPGQFSGCTSKDVDLLVWLDPNSRVRSLYSTYHGPEVYTANDGFSLPTVVYDYDRVCLTTNQDRERILSGYNFDRHNILKWYVLLFIHLLNCSVLNAHHLYKQKHTNITLDKFKKELVNQILIKHTRTQDNIL